MMKSEILENLSSRCSKVELKPSETIEIKKSGIYTLTLKSDTKINVFSNTDIILEVELLGQENKIELYIDSNSNVGYYVINRALDIKTNAFLKENAYLETYDFFANEKSNTDFKADLLGYHAIFEYSVGMYAKGSEDHSHKISVNHLVPSTDSNINKRAVLNDKAKCTFDVESFIKKSSSKSSAYQKSKIINLSDESISHVNPILLIDEYDVMAGHGATVSKISKNDLYYLQSRGLTVQDSLKLITFGFLLEIVPKYMLEKIEKLLEGKMNHE